MEVLLAAVADSGEVFGQVHGGIAVVADAEQQYLTVELVHAADRTVRAVRYVCRMRAYDAGSRRAARRKGVRAVAAQDAREAPESIGDHTHSAAGRDARIERVIVVVAHARHDQRAFGTQRRFECGDQSARSVLDRPDPGEGGVREEHAARRYAELDQLPNQLGLWNHAFGAMSPSFSRSG